MYLKTMNAVRQHMLYRPMTQDNRDILFSGRVTTGGKPDDITFDPEVTHLTCFLGGMVGMGAKLFGLESDMRIAEKLTDGCVWAYEVQTTGIMPEQATVVACEDLDNCVWNQTLWYEYIDPMGAVRDQGVKEYVTNRDARRAKEEAAKLAASADIVVDERPAPDGLQQFGNEFAQTSSNAPTEDTGKAVTDPLAKRGADITEESTRDSQSDPKLPRLPRSEADPTAEEQQEAYQIKLQETQDELSSIGPSKYMKGAPKVEPPKVLGTPTVNSDGVTDPNLPLTHEQYVTDKISREMLAPGFVKIPSRKYILR